MGRYYRVGSLVIILVLPIIIYVFLRFFSTQHFDTLGILGERSVVTNAENKPDTVYHTVFNAFPDFRFQTQRGDYITWDSLRGHIYLVNIFSTRCPGICPQLGRAMHKMQEYYDHDPRIRFLSITLDPEHDSVAVLKKYAAGYKADPRKWFFITGESEKLRKLAEDAYLYKTSSYGGGNADAIGEPTTLMIVDPEGRLRVGKYFCNGTKSDDVEALIKELKILKIEYAAKGYPQGPIKEGEKN